jgi:chaperonin GroEL
MSKEILNGHEARLRIKAGVDKACAAVAPTLGPVGMTAMIEFPGLDPIECDDGVTILKNLEFKDHYENIGLQMLRKAALRASNEGGDGTSTATVLTHALVNEAFKEIAHDSSKIREVRERLDKGLAETLAELGKIKREVTEDDIEKIATIASLDPEVAKLISEIIKEVGVNGVVSVEKGSKIGYSKEIVKGARFERGLISPYFINNKETESTVLNDAYIILADRVVSTNEQIIGLLNSIGTGKDILIIADDVNSVALGTLATNAMQGRANIACVRNPYSASRARDFLFDLAALTGGTVISEEMGMRLDTSTVEQCGRAEKVIVNRDTTTIIGGRSSDELEKRIAMIKNKLEESISDYEKLMLEDRLACLTGGIGVIRVGAYTDTEFNAKKYKFENAINATQAALQEGIVAGGGVSLLDVSTRIPSNSLFRNALIAPFTQMSINAGMKDMEGFRWLAHEIGTGFNFKTHTKGNMFDEGIVDPFKVVRIALESATTIAKSIIGVETCITTEDVKE